MPGRGTNPGYSFGEKSGHPFREYGMIDPNRQMADRLLAELQAAAYQQGESGEMREPKRLTDDQLVKCFNTLSIAGYASYSLRLQDHIAALEAEIARLQAENMDANHSVLKLVNDLKYIAGIVERGTGSPIADTVSIRDTIREYVKQLEAELQAAGERENALREALAIAVNYHGVGVDYDVSAWSQLAVLALATPPSVYAQRAQKTAAVVEVAKGLAIAVREFAGKDMSLRLAEVLVKRYSDPLDSSRFRDMRDASDALRDALAALDDVEPQP